MYALEGMEEEEAQASVGTPEGTQAHDAPESPVGADECPPWDEPGSGTPPPVDTSDQHPGNPAARRGTSSTRAAVQGELQALRQKSAVAQWCFA